MSAIPWEVHKRKLLPALYHLDREGRLPADGRIIAVSRGAMSQDAYRALVHESCKTYVPDGHFDDAAWARFAARLDYIEVDVAESAGFARLAAALLGRELVVRCFYLATAPELFGPIATHLASTELISPESRVVLEKPLGKDLVSAQAINAVIGASFAEQ